MKTVNELGIRQSKTIYWASGIVSICGIIFEVLFGAAGSYILGDGVKQYTLTISLFLTGMGIGASISERVTRNLIPSFIWIEYAIGIIGGLSTFLFFGVTAFLPDGTDAIFLYGITLVVGGLTGLELPILIRKANDIGVTLRKSTARVLFSDYAGGLIGGLLFVFFLRPEFGLVKSAFIVGLINVAVALWVLYYFRKEITRFRLHLVSGITFFLILFSGVFWGEEMAFSFEQKLYRDPIIYNEQTDYQQIILTKERGDVRLFLDGQLQMSSTDEYRYHETLVHPAVEAAESPERVLVLGGGDGLVLRELWKYDEIKKVDLVDLDPAVVELAETNYDLLQLNEGSFDDPRVTVHHQDAFSFMEQSNTFYDVIIVDLPDPNNESLNKLYTLQFYQLLRNSLEPGGAMMVQATSPTFATEVYWTIDHTVRETGLRVENLHVDVPSFGDWGFIFAEREESGALDEMTFNVETKFLNEETLQSLRTFGKDIDRDITDDRGNEFELQPNTLIDPILLEMYDKAWANY
ncbi:polyamine aminopropyltransferase [Jeotgalibacillus terrae]|uniref:Polyamine aminopropyltransferase n=1 Tax=Jeotgalibacillus terrae TaxID=587735 RepID=A0ABW5ZHU7_9BACL|nr:polyamine aminopropyltransferase [Jeotgalibacillus terrae]MBM7580368.1 spermidine synthase [Jeotgalibacillus terrae]